MNRLGRHWTTMAAFIAMISLIVLAPVVDSAVAGGPPSVGQLHAGAVEFALENSSARDGDPFRFGDFLEVNVLVSEYLVDRKGLDADEVDSAIAELTVAYLDAGAFADRGDGAELLPFDDFADALIRNASTRPRDPISDLMAEQLSIVVALTRDPSVTANDFRQYMHQVFAKQDWRGADIERAADAVKIADSSLRLTRRAEGGLGDGDHRVNKGGGGVDPDPGGTLKLCNNSWWKVVAADIVACVACSSGGPVSCIACGATASVLACLGD